MLKGTLDDFTLSDIFRLLSFTKKTGKLEVKRSAGEGNVFFRDGDVYFAQSSLKKEPLGQKLIRSGSLTETQLLTALDLHASTGQRVGEILLDQGAITQDQLVGAVAEQIEDAAFDLLRWQLGEFTFEAHDRFEVEIPIAVSVENLIMEASRRLDELEVIERKIPSEKVVLKVAPAPPQGARQINISPEEWRLLVLVDGTRTVGELCEMAGLDDFSGVRTLYGMISTGLLDIAELGPAPSDEVMLTPPSPVDMRMKAVPAGADDESVEAEAEADVAGLATDVDVAEAEAQELEITGADAPELEINEAEAPDLEITEPEALEDEPDFEPADDDFDEPTVVRAPEEVAVNEAYEEIASLATGGSEDLQSLEEAAGEAARGTESEPAEADAADLLEYVAMEAPLDESGSMPVASEPGLDDYDELISDFRDEFTTAETDVDTDFEPADAMSPEYAVDDSGVEAEAFDVPMAESALDEDSDPALEDYTDSALDEVSDAAPEEFTAAAPEEYTDAAAEDAAESMPDEYADTPLEELLGPEPQPASDPDVSEVIASGVPDEWFDDPSPEADVSPEPPAPPSPPDPFLDDILNGEISPAHSYSPDVHGPRVDRAAVVRELAGLFNDEDQGQRRVRAPATEAAEVAAEGDEDSTPSGAAKRRVEDDDQINKGLIGRFIDGVKGM